MPGKREDIPIARPQGDTDLKPEFTYDDLWAEIDKLFIKYEERQPGDIDYRDMMKRYGVCQNTAHIRMDTLVQSGKFRFVLVKGNASAPIRVIRRM